MPDHRVGGGCIVALGIGEQVISAARQCRLAVASRPRRSQDAPQEKQVLAVLGRSQHSDGFGSAASFRQRIE
jgi:hypothetical protein